MSDSPVPKMEKPRVELGCTSLVIIALIVMLFSENNNTRSLKKKIDQLSKKIDTLEQKIDRLQKTVTTPPAPAAVPAVPAAPATATTATTTTTATEDNDE